MLSSWASWKMLVVVVSCGVVLILITGPAVSTAFRSPIVRSSSSRVSHRRTTKVSSSLSEQDVWILLRGGADSSSSSSSVISVKDDDDEEEEDEDEEDEEEDEEEEESASSSTTTTSSPSTTSNTLKMKPMDTQLATAALKSVTKTKQVLAQQKTAILKQTVQSKLLSSNKQQQQPKKKNPSSSYYKRAIPYIIRAAMNPFTFWAMTRSYWASLFNLNYLHDHQQSSSSSGELLRTAREELEKRKVTLPNSQKRGKKTMKRGQAKTLNDLPKLSS